MCCPAARFFSLSMRLALAAALAALLYHSRGDSRSSSFPVDRGRSYELLITAPRLADLTKDTRLDVSVTNTDGLTLRKSLHPGDADWYMLLKPGKTGKVTVALPPEATSVKVSLTPLATGASKDSQLASSFHNTWQTAEPIELGRPVYASGDERPYIPRLASPAETFDQMLAGIHWYRLDYKGPGDRLVHFRVDLLDRDVPADVTIFTVANGTPVEYVRGRERFEPERSTNFHGLFAFAPRVLSPGTYHIRVMGNHPFYKLETDHYPVPPYTDPRQAVRTAMDYIVRKGDSWHSNIPREGGIALRHTSNLQETRLCIACHPTQFSTRGEFFALEAGYPVRARSSVQFLLERLYNNPRPIYGKTEASWARMIHAPGNVLSRVAYLTNKYDTLLTGDRREELYRGVASYLEMYWPGMTEPSHESNGNLPRISGFEVAMHNAMLFEDLHKRTGRGRYGELRQQIEQVIVGGKPDDVLDLCWKIDALVWLGPKKYAGEIRRLAGDLLAHRQADGRWAMPFGLEEVQYDFARQKKVVKPIPLRAGMSGPAASDFQTWHAIYALARAGFTLEDRRLKQAFDLALSRQTPSGAWQGNPEYKNFDTPFRDTQYALMAIATLFPGPLSHGGTKRQNGAFGWDQGAALPATFDKRDSAAVVAALDRHWDRPQPAVVSRIRSLLDSPHVIVRAQAAVALGRFADADSAAGLGSRLGDSSKLVQRAAAWSLRQIASRKGVPPAIETALRSPDDRTRWGALRIFNQHFRYLVANWQLGGHLIRIAGTDPVTANKLAASQALYQWWYWDASAGHRRAIEESLIAGLGRPEHPWVRRGFQEAYLGVLDDNVRYLYGSWIPRVKRPEDRAAIDAGHKAAVLEQATRFRNAMVSGNSLQREGLLRALFSHHVREGLPDVSAFVVPLPPTVHGSWVNGYKFSALFDPVTGGTAAFSRIGNDAEPPLFYRDSAPLVNEAILAALSDPDPKVIASALGALKALRGINVEAAVANRVVAQLAGGHGSVRPIAAEIVKSQLKRASMNKELLDRLAGTGDALTLDALSGLETGPSPTAVSERLLRTASDDRAFPPLVALAGALGGEAPVREHVLKGLASKRPQAQRAALRWVLAQAGKVATPAEFPDRYGPFAVGGALSVIAGLDYSGGRHTAVLADVRRILLTGLRHPVHTIRAQALTTLRSVAPLHNDAEILTRVAELRKDAEKDVRASAVSFESSRLARAGTAGVRADDILDYFFFKEKVEPILFAKGPDGQACVQCHANHTILQLNDADEFGVITLTRSRANYAAAARMVDVKEPEASLLVNKPLAPLDDEGIGDSQSFTHGGGVRWSGQKQSTEYRTILQWIQGARL
jgi:hypothetical protein